MKNTLRKVIRAFGFELMHGANDPILRDLREIHEGLRLKQNDYLRWDDTLPGPAAHASLRHMLILHGIDLVFDVGANRGQFATLVRRLGYTGDIISFEPMLAARKELEALAGHDRRWRILPFAIGDTQEDRELQIFRDDTFSSFHATNQLGRDRFGDMLAPSHTEKVAVRRLDDLWHELVGDAARRVLLKTDTQGHDLAVLEGAASVLNSVYSIVTEATLRPIYDQSPLFADIHAWLEARQFAASGLFPISHVPEDLSLIEMDCVFTRLRGANQ